MIISDNRSELNLYENIIPTYKNTQELIEKIEFYLNNKQEYDSIVNRAYSLTRKNLNSKICVKEMLDNILKF